MMDWDTFLSLKKNLPESDKLASFLKWRSQNSFPIKNWD